MAITYSSSVFVLFVSFVVKAMRLTKKNTKGERDTMYLM